MNRNPLLSVIVANYNNQPYIEDCLDSILGQTYKDLEIIVSDDASTDNSPGIIRKYETRYPGIVKGTFPTENRGVAQTRHEAIIQARGDYITTLDSDDYYYDTQKLEKEMELTAHYKLTADSDIIAYSNIAFVKSDKTLIGLQGDSEPIKEGHIFDEIISRSCMIPRDFIVKRSAYFDVGGYDFRFKTHEDWDLKIRLAAKYPFYYTHCTGTAYRRDSGGLSRISYHRRTRNLWDVFFKNITLIPLKKRKMSTRAFTRCMAQRDRDYMEILNRNFFKTVPVHFNRFMNNFRLYMLVWIKRNVDKEIPPTYRET